MVRIRDKWAISNSIDEQRRLYRFTYQAQPQYACAQPHQADTRPIGMRPTIVTGESVQLSLLPRAATEPVAVTDLAVDSRQPLGLDGLGSSSRVLPFGIGFSMHHRFLLTTILGAGRRCVC